MLKYGEKDIENAVLEVWENKHKENDYEISIDFPEFTCKCPRSGYPDFATIRIKYIPNEFVVELKSLKLFLNQYRDKYISHEDAANEIFNELKDRLKPKHLEVIGDFTPRGNVKTVIKIGY